MKKGATNKTWRYIVIIGVLFVLAFLNIAEGANEAKISKFVEENQSLGLIRNVYLYIDDEATGNCWTNTEQVKQKARLILEQSGIHVYDEPLLVARPFTTTLVIAGLGKRASNNANSPCFGAIRVFTLREVYSDFGDVSIKYYSTNFEVTATAIDSDNLNDVFLSNADTYVSEFSSDVIAGRRVPLVSEILKKWPPEKTKPITVKEFNKIIGRRLNKKGK